MELTKKTLLREKVEAEKQSEGGADSAKVLTVFSGREYNFSSMTKPNDHFFHDHISPEPKEEYGTRGRQTKIRISNRDQRVQNGGHNINLQ